MLKHVVIGLMAVATMVKGVPMPQDQNLDCFNRDNDLLSCFAVKAISTMKRATRSANLQIMDGVTFVRDVPLERTAKAMKTETEMLAELPRDASDKTLSIASQLFDSTVTFFKTHSLQLAAPEGGIARSLDEGRTKIKNKFSPGLVSALGIKLMALAPLLLGTLVLLTLKALVVGKVALIIAGILALQKYFGNGNYGWWNAKAGPWLSSGWAETPSSGWSSAPAVSQHQGYYRSLNDRIDSGKISYTGQQTDSTNEAH